MFVHHNLLAAEGGEIAVTIEMVEKASLQGMYIYSMCRLYSNSVTQPFCDLFYRTPGNCVSLKMY